MYRRFCDGPGCDTELTKGEAWMTYSSAEANPRVRFDFCMICTPGYVYRWLREHGHTIELELPEGPE